MHKPLTPSAYLRAPNLARPEPQGMRVHPGLPPRPMPPPAPALPDARLTVRPVRNDRPGQPNDRVGLTKALMRALPHLKLGSPIDLVPPAQRGGPWFLDTRPTAARRLGQLDRFKVPALSRGHYLLPAIATRPGHFGGLMGSVGYREALAFALGPEVTEEVCVTFHGQKVCEPRGTGYYELRPLW